jgi:O-antigen/teichoic acid export membrane protein
LTKIIDNLFSFKVLKSEFVKHSFVLFLGLVFAQFLSVLLYPVFSRLYTPEQFGTFALFVSTTGILSLLSSGVYEQAILLPREDKKALALMALPLFLTLFQCSFFLLLFFLFSDFIADRLLNNTHIKPFLLLIPVSILLNNIYTTFTFYANRKKHYTFISQSTINQGLTTNILKLLLGTAKYMSTGLIFGRLTGQLTSAVQLVLQVIKKSDPVRKEMDLSRTFLKEVALIYKNFPAYRMPLALMNTFSTALPVFVLNKYFSPYDAGQYSLAAGVILTPVVLVVGSVSKVINQNIIERIHSGNPVHSYIARVLKIVMPIAAIFFIVFFFFSKSIFVFLFGSNWLEAGRMGSYILPWVFMVLFTTPFGFIPDIFFRQKKAMLIDALYLVMRIGSMAVGVVYKDVFLALGLFVLTGCTILTYNLIWYLSLLKNNDRKMKTDLMVLLGNSNHD